MSKVFRSSRLGVAKLLMGQLREASAHLQDARRILDRVKPEHRHPLHGVDPFMMIMSYTARARRLQGFLDQSRICIEEALDFAERLGHAHTLAFALFRTADEAQLKGKNTEAIRRARRALELCERLDYKTRYANALLELGRALIKTGEVENGTRMFREAYALWKSATGVQFCSEWAAEAAELLLRAGRREDALEFVLAGEAAQNNSEERFHQAELLRVRGRLCQADGDDAGAERGYRQAINIAEQQGAKLVSLRAAANLASLYQSQGKDADAEALLRPIYDWFAEGFDYPDLLRARAALTGLSAPA